MTHVAEVATSAPETRTINALAVALYATDAHTRGTLTDAEFHRLVHQGTRTLGDDRVNELARRLDALDTAWVHGTLTDADYNSMRASLLPDVERLDRCYGHAIGEPYP